MKKTWNIALVSVALTFGSVACSDDSNAPTLGPSTTTVAPEADAPDASGSVPGSGGSKGETVTDVPDIQGSVDDYVGALQDASLETCESVGGVLVVDGTVTNPVDEAQQYRIYVSAMAGQDTRGVVQVDTLPVDGGQTVDWSTEIELSDTGLTCLLRVERFAPQS